MLKHLILIISLLVLFGSEIQAQESTNPFEIEGRKVEQRESIEANQPRIQTSNPFDLQPTEQSIQSLDFGNEMESTTDEGAKLLPAKQGSRIGISLLLILPLALLLTLFRGVFNDFFESAYRDRKFNQFFRRMNSMWVIPNILLYIFFFLSISVFVHLVLTYYGYNMFDNIAQSIGILAVCIASYFSIKHSLIYFLGNTFEVKNESNRYSLLILTFNIIAGVFLTPFSLLLLLGPDSIKGAVIVIGLLFCLLTMSLLLLRSLSVSNRLLSQHSLHFFMYLCTIEIAPLFIVAKLLI